MDHESASGYERDILESRRAMLSLGRKREKNNNEIKSGGIQKKKRPCTNAPDLPASLHEVVEEGNKSEGKRRLMLYTFCSGIGE
jgi:hypothetical protein